jgi:hypothetical protein
MEVGAGAEGGAGKGGSRVVRGEGRKGGEGRKPLSFPQRVEADRALPKDQSEEWRWVPGRRVGGGQSPFRTHP